MARIHKPHLRVSRDSWPNRAGIRRSARTLSEEPAIGAAKWRLAFGNRVVR